MKKYYVYILTNYSNTTLYVGITNNIERRLYEHRNKFVKSFSSKYNLKKIVYYEQFADAYSAISREKQLKNWHRAWKINLIRQKNPHFIDILEDAETSSA